VFNNGASHVAAGGFTGSYNFGSQTATMAINISTETISSPAARPR
jgi:hypothetical protein